MNMTLDVSNVLDANVGENGLNTREIDDLTATIDSHTERLASEPLPFMELPQTRFQFEEMRSIAATLAKMHVRNIMLLGIGGSALGTQTIFEALLHPFHNCYDDVRKGRPRYFVVDNIDPDKINALIEVVKPELADTVLLVISKSGETPETVSQFMIFKGIMRDIANLNQRIILITDKEKGILNKIARKEGYRTLIVPDGVGGRFSVLTPVGMFPAILMGIPVDEIMDGAAAMLSDIQKKTGSQNMASILAAILFAMDKHGKNINVLMPYSERLSAFADWFRQLESESLGKEGKGITPTKSIGVTDQHSQLQLYMQGPKDKCIIFFYSAQSKRLIPDSFPYIEDVSYLANKDMNDLFSAEFNGTKLSLTEAGTPNLTLMVHEITPYTLGALFSLFEMVIVYLGKLYKVNAFDQPGVEQGKIYTKALMGKDGFESVCSRINSFSSRPKTVIHF